MFATEAKLADCTDYNIIYADRKDIEILLEILERESEMAICWFKENKMIINPNKFQAKVININKKPNAFYTVNMNNQIVKSADSIMLLVAEIDNNLNFDKHISKICKKSGSKINPISRIQNYLGEIEKETLVNIFVTSSFNYSPLA